MQYSATVMMLLLIFMLATATLARKSTKTKCECNTPTGPATCASNCSDPPFTYNGTTTCGRFCNRRSNGVVNCDDTGLCPSGTVTVVGTGCTSNTGYGMTGFNTVVVPPNSPAGGYIGGGSCATGCCVYVNNGNTGPNYGSYASGFIVLSVIALVSRLGEQPYFPSQIVFSPDNGKTIFAIDEINQRAYKSIPLSPSLTQISYAMEHFPYSIPDSPQSKYYVQLLIDPVTVKCMYGTYWKYGENNFNTFPSHWWFNASLFEIKNYLIFNYEMIHSNDSSQDEDYWYANTTCQVDTGENYPCQEIYFKKDTEIPLRFVQVVRRRWDLIQITTNYKIISMGKPDEKYFDSIPIYWSLSCRDVNLGLLYYPQIVNISLHQSAEIHISLTAPPLRIHGNDTVRMHWNTTQCNDCFTFSPKELSFNMDNFQKEQILRITRVKDSPLTTLLPIFFGAGFDFVPPEMYSIRIQ